MSLREDAVNLKARHELTRLRYTLENLRGVANDRLVDNVSRKAGALFTDSIKKQIKAKGWSNFANNQVELRNMGVKNKSRQFHRGGTYTYVVLYDTPKRSKTVPYMRFQDWGTRDKRAKGDIKASHKGIPPQHFSRTAWRLHHRAAERSMLNDYLKAMRKMAKTQRKLRNPRLSIRPARSA